MLTPVRLAFAAGGAAFLAASLLGSGAGSPILASLVGAGAHAPLFQARGPAAAGTPGGPDLATARAASSGFGAYEVPKAGDGHFHVQAEIEGRAVPMLVDTGASMVVLSWEDARAAGLDPAPADFTLRMQTANGMSHAAPVQIREMRLGPSIDVRDVKAAVAEQGALSGSLLGMSFLSRLAGFEVRDGRLLLRP